MTTSGAQHHLTGRLTVALPPEQAFRLFTARGEQDWVDEWRPRFPVPPADDTAPGTVFETDGHHRATTWVVVDRDAGRRIRYARVTPSDAGIVTVTLADAGGNSDVTVSYELTARTDAGRERLREFAAAYPAFLRSWQGAIAAALPRLAAEVPPQAATASPRTASPAAARFATDSPATDSPASDSPASALPGT